MKIIFQHSSHLKANSQKGAVLVVSLLFLLIMTILGVSTMSTNVLEEKMVGNSRQLRIAFQAADSCNSRLVVENNFTFEDTWEDAWESATNMGHGSAKNAASYSAERKFIMDTSPSRNSGYSAIKFRASHNEYRCTGSGASGAQVVLRQGVYQITPKLN
ncbi:MAG: pilus assembly PilX N-terminal domain-containing protein [Methylococcales bacterium]|nr:pilus assembly PilX N-terminal domain-containing protein [Methylococcales bacterium]